MMNRILIVTFILSSFRLCGQGIKFNVGIPVLSHNLTSVDEIANGVNDSYTNNIWLPNLRLGVSYKSVYFGIDTYSARIFNPDNVPSQGLISSIRLETYSFLLGYQKVFDKLKFRVGSGATFNDDVISTYTDLESNPREFWICREINPWGLNFWSSLDYEIWNKVMIGINFRFNPMFKEFQPNPERQCWFPHGHDRIHYFVSQLMVGYSF